MLRIVLTFVLLLFGTSQAAWAVPDAVAPPASAADSEYTLAPGDRVRILVFGEDALTGDYVITSGGNLSFPLIGTLKATDKTVEALQVALVEALSNGYLTAPRVSIQVLSFRPYYILGEVNRPGEYPVTTGLTAQQAVAAAGGYTYRANKRRLYLKRVADPAEQRYDLRKPVPIYIRAGDTIRIGERHF